MDRSDYQKTYREKYKDQAKRVNLTFSLREFVSISRGANSSGIAVAAYAKRCAMEAHHHRAASIPEEVLEQLEDLRRMVRIMGNNLNQMAKHSNRVKQVLDDNEPFVHLQNLEAELKAAIAQVAKHSAKSQTDDGS